MPEIAAAAEVPGPEAEVMRLWEDTSRWPSFVDGFGRVTRDDGEVLVWDSTPHGPGRTRETRVAHGVVDIETEQLSGRRTASYHDGVFQVVLAYDLKEKTPFTLFFVKRSLRDSLRRTVARFAVERRADADLIG